MAMSHRVSLLVPIGLLWAAGCAPTAAPTQLGAGSQPSTTAGPKRVTAAIMGDPRTLRNTINAAGGSGSVPGLDAVEDMVSVGLAIQDNRGRLAPRLAEAVPSLENALWTIHPDGRMQTVWKLRAGASWHDGTPVTADDFVFTAAVGQNRELPIFRDQMYSLIEGVEATSSGTVSISWKQPFVEADQLFNTETTVPLPKHLLERSYAEDRATFTQIPYWNEEFVGTGPFRLREWALGSHLVLAAFDQYVLGRPRIDEVVVRFISDPNTLMANIAAGAVELSLGRGLSIEQAVQVRDQWPAGRVEASPVNWIAMYPQFIDPTPRIVADVQFRRAVYHAVDRQQLVVSLQAGLARVADSILIPEDPAFGDVERSVVRYEYNPRRATEMVEALGYSRGTDGIFRSSAGERLSVELRTVRHDLYEKSLIAVGDYLQRVGIGFEPVVVPPPRVNDREYRATFPAFEVIENPNDFSRLTRLRLLETPLPENRFTGRNRARYMDAEFDGLLDRYFTTIAKPQRAQVAAQIVHHMTDQLVWMGLFHQAEPTMIGNRIQNVEARHEGSTQAWNAHEWDVR